MLTTLLAVQAGINLALVVALYLQWRERRAAARFQVDREARLETLADDLCAVGRSLLSRPPSGALSPPAPGDLPAAEPEPSPATGRADATPEATARPRLAAGAKAPGPGPSADPLTPPVAIRDTQAAAIREAQADDQASPPAAPSERLRVVAALLDRGLSVADVAAQTATPEGEVEVFRNLRRSTRRLSSSPETLSLRR